MRKLAKPMIKNVGTSFMGMRPWAQMFVSAAPAVSSMKVQKKRSARDSVISLSTDGIRGGLPAEPESYTGSMVKGNFLGAAIVAVIYTVYILMRPLPTKSQEVIALVVLNALTIVLMAFAFR